MGTLASWLAAALAALVLASVPAGPMAETAARELDAVDAALLASPGAALRHARDSVRAGETERAEALLAAIAASHAGVADYADLERMRLYTLVGRPDDALALAEAWPHPESPLRAEVYAEASRARIERGDEELARDALALALAGSDEGSRRAELIVELGRSHLRSQQAEQAAQRFLEAWVKHPTASAAEGLDAEIQVLEQKLGRTLLTADRYRQRADVLFRARHNESALAAYERALDLGLRKSTAARARQQRAETLFRMRRYPEAAEAYAALSGSEARIEQARARARSGHVEEAAATLEKIGEETRGRTGSYATLVAALLWDDAGRTERALPLFRGLARGGSRHASAALWRLGWDAYRSGRLAEAREHLGRLQERETDPLSQLRARYWDARAAEKLGDASVAEAFGEMAREFPLSYYGWRASSRAALGPSEAPPTEVARGRSALAPSDLARPRILLEAGWEQEARDELDRLFVRAKGLDDRLALAELYANAGEFNRPQRLVMSGYPETLARSPVPQLLELWWHAWPAPYPEAVRDATRGARSVEPALLYAIMREESGYRPEVRSVSGARGLLQLMPDTASRVASRVALPAFDPDDLFLPDVNIRLGAAYLHELLAQFSGRASAAIGSYNAGPHRVARWLEEGPLEDDEWVEAIPYEQTRTYTKRVLRSMHAYRVLY